MTFELELAVAAHQLKSDEAARITDDLCELFDGRDRAPVLLDLSRTLPEGVDLRRSPVPKRLLRTSVDPLVSLAADHRNVADRPHGRARTLHPAVPARGHELELPVLAHVDPRAIR